jgi:hypothetical protein
MDAVLSDADTFNWPTETVLKPKNIPAANIGVAAHSIANPAFFAPVTVGIATPSADEPLKAQLQSVQPLFGLRWRLGQQIATGSSATCKSDSSWEHRSNQPSQALIDFQIQLQTVDVACLEIASKRDSDSTWRREIVWIGVPK